MEEEANEFGTPEVFRNKVVLREMFKYLPTSTLISSCSLVNKHCREEARSFIRDYRECTVHLGIGNSGWSNLWNQLCELDSALGKMQTIPFNSLHVVVTCYNTGCNEAAEVSDLKNFISRFPLKYLSVLEHGEMELCGDRGCPAASAILELVRENSFALLEFESRAFTTGPYGVFTEWEPPRFENLKKLSIARNSSITADCAKKIVGGASNLRAIHNNCLRMIPDVIPEKMYGTLKRLAFGVKDVDRIEKFVDKLGHLEELILDLHRSYEIETDMRVIALLQKLLASNNSTLCHLVVSPYPYHDVNPFNRIRSPLLPSVKSLSVCSSFFESLDHISALNFRESLPNLCQVHIQELDYHFNDYNDVHAVMFAEEDVIVAPNASESAMELELSIKDSVSISTLATLRRLFSRVITMKISFLYLSPTHFTLLVLGLAGIMWPNLQSLSLAINGSFIDDAAEILQAEVCAQVFGLHPEEWKLLCQQGQDFLKRVQFAPSRPCVWTMKG